MNLRFHELVGRHYRAISLTAIGFIFYLLYTSGLSHNPPGFFLDESGFAYNAYLIARTRAGEFGGHWPLFFQFYDGPFVQYATPCTDRKSVV